MATIKLRKGVNPLVFLGTSEVAFNSLSWITAQNIAFIFAVSSTGFGYVSYTPGKPSGLSSFKPVSDGTIAGYIVVTNVALTVDAALFVAVAGPALTQLATPTGLQATGTSTSAISVVANSVANASSYRLYTSGLQTGSYTQLGGVLASPAYSHTGLSAAQTRWYKWQAVGNGTTYSDSALSAAFSGATLATNTPTKNIKLCFDGNSIIFGLNGDLAGRIVQRLRQRLTAAGDTRSVFYDLSDTTHPVNVAISGQTEQQMVDNFADMAATFDAAYNCIPVTLERYNQIRGYSSTVTASQAFAVFEQYDALVQQSFGVHIAYTTPPDKITVAAVGSNPEYRTRPDFAQVQKALSDMVRNKAAASAGHLFAASIDLDTYYDPSDVPNQSSDGVHPSQEAINNHYVAERAVDALFQYLFGTAQPAPVTTAPPQPTIHYVDGFTTLPTLVGSQNAQYFEGNSATSTLVDNTDYGNSLLQFGGQVASGADFDVLTQYIAGLKGDGIFGADDVDGLRGYQSYLLSNYKPSGGTGYVWKKRGDGGYTAGSYPDLADGNWYGFGRKTTNGVTSWYLLYAPDFTAAVQLATIPGMSYSGMLVFKGDMYSPGGRIEYPSGRGITARAGGISTYPYSTSRKYFGAFADDTGAIYSNGTGKYTTTLDDFFQDSVFGATGVIIYSPLSPNAGSVKVTINGQSYTFSAYTPGSPQPSTEIGRITGLPTGDYTFTVQNKGGGAVNAMFSDRIQAIV